MPNHEATMNYAKHVELIRFEGGNLKLTEKGIDFLQMNPEKMYELSQGQKQFLIRACYLHGPFRESCHKALSHFSPSYGNKTYRWSWIDDSPIPGGEGLLENLRELDLLSRDDMRYEVNAEFVETVASFLAEGKGFTEKQFLEYLQEKEEVGEIAESLVMKFEAKRLRDAGHMAESMSVRSVSDLRVNAGYDIESFDGKSVGVKYDRFIEVKGARSPKVRFFWSENEIKKATELGKKYWIYFQGGIDLGAKKSRNKLLAFQDPIRSILEDGRFEKTPQGLLVEADLHGDSL